jgi:hypothetical protein
MPTETALPPTSRKITICDPVESPAGSLPYCPYFHLATLRKTTHFPIQAPVGIRLRMCLILNGIKFLIAGKKQIFTFRISSDRFCWHPESKSKDVHRKETKSRREPTKIGSPFPYPLGVV